MLIATPRESFVTCAAHAAASEVVDAPEYAAFDYVPVSSQGDIVGLFRRRGREAHVPPADGALERLMEPLYEHNLISADAGIIDFLSEADRQPYRLVVKGTVIAGIVTLADLQARSNAAPRSSASFPTRRPSPASSAPSCSSRTTNGP